jgi:hypothetical protein
MKKMIIGGASVQAISAQNELSSPFIFVCASAKHTQSEVQAGIRFEA